MFENQSMRPVRADLVDCEIYESNDTGKADTIDGLVKDGTVEEDDGIEDVDIEDDDIEDDDTQFSHKDDELKFWVLRSLTILAVSVVALVSTGHLLTALGMVVLELVVFKGNYRFKAFRMGCVNLAEVFDRGVDEMCRGTIDCEEFLDSEVRLEVPPYRMSLREFLKGYLLETCTLMDMASIGIVLWSM